MAEDWSDAELQAAVDAYLEMARLEEFGKPYSKREVYRELAAKFGRTAKAFEYRMQNISAVLNDLDRPWIPGLKPASNVGPNVKPRIEALLERPLLNAQEKSQLRLPSDAQGVKVSARGPTTVIGIPLPQKEKQSQRLDAAVLHKATPEHVYAAVQRLLTGDVKHPFGESTDYDLVADDGSRLPPKAVFGLALSAALGEPIEPKHFTAGDTSPCFKLLRAAGFQVVRKGEAAEELTGDLDTDEEVEVSEGKRKIYTHIRSERKPALARAKKAQYRRLHGKLECERCGLDPVAVFGSQHGEACIEVHHATTQVADMQEGHKTTFADLQCLCANCHRFVHRALRLGLQL